MSNEIIMTWDEIVNAWDECQSPGFEEYICQELGEDYPGEYSQELFDYLNRKYENKKFRVIPNADHIRWSGSLSTDFMVRIVSE